MWVGIAAGLVLVLYLVVSLFSEKAAPSPEVAALLRENGYEDLDIPARDLAQVMIREQDEQDQDRFALVGTPKIFSLPLDGTRTDYVELRPGFEYKVYGHCGQGCRRLYIGVFETLEDEIGLDSAIAINPILSLTPPYEVNAQLEIVIDECTDDNGCMASYSVYSRPSESEVPEQAPVSRGPTDPSSYDVFVFRDQTWLAENLRIEASNSICYAEDQVNCDEEGYLYRWDAASVVCHQLGPDWRLPSETDWLALTREYGGAYGDAGAGPHDEAMSGSAAYRALAEGGNAGFNGSFGGKRLYSPERDTHSFYDYGRIGYYWSSTADANDAAWATGMTFRATDTKVLRARELKMTFYSVRCLRG